MQEQPSPPGQRECAYTPPPRPRQRTAPPCAPHLPGCQWRGALVVHSGSLLMNTPSLASLPFPTTQPLKSCFWSISQINSWPLDPVLRRGFCRIQPLLGGRAALTGLQQVVGCMLLFPAPGQTCTTRSPIPMKGQGGPQGTHTPFFTSSDSQGTPASFVQNPRLSGA